MIILSLVGATLLFVGYLYAKKALTQLTEQYTEATPAQIESVEVPADQMKSLQERVARFASALDKQQQEELVLTADDINALIGGDPSFKDARNRLFVRIEGDKVRGKVSWPLPDMGPLKLKGRFINGDATFNVALTNGTLFVGVLDVAVKGKTLPPQLTAALRQENLAREVMKNPQTAAKFEKFDRIEVKDGKVILRTKSATQP